MDELGGKDINDVMKEMEDAEVGTYNIQTILENLREIKAKLQKPLEHDYKDEDFYIKWCALLNQRRFGGKTRSSFYYECRSGSRLQNSQFFSHFGLAWRKAWFTHATQMQTQMEMQMQKQGNTRVNYLNANVNAKARADARNGKMFIFLRLHLRFTRVNRGKANAMQTQG